METGVEADRHTAKGSRDASSSDGAEEEETDARGLRGRNGRWWHQFEGEGKGKGRRRCPMDASFLPEALSTAWRAIQLGEGPGAQEGGAAAPVEEMSIAGWVGAESCTTPGWGQTGGAPEKQTAREMGQKVSQKPRENKCQENGQSDKHSTQARQDKH